MRRDAYHSLDALPGARPARLMLLPVGPSRTSTDRYSEAAAADHEHPITWRDETQIFVNALQVGDVLSPEDGRRVTELHSLLLRLPELLTGGWLDDSGDAS